MHKKRKSTEHGWVKPSNSNCLLANCPVGHRELAGGMPALSNVKSVVSASEAMLPVFNYLRLLCLLVAMVSDS
jgi:hypothetical protein